MRLRNVKNKESILANCPILITDPKSKKGLWQEEFGNNNPTYIEMGMGKGDFIIQNALTYPHINFIGIEKYDSVLAKAIGKVEYSIPNLRFVRMDALGIEDVFNHEIERIYLNFSDPWPKERHARRRLSSEEFLEKYENIFKNTKEIHQKTDNRNLFEFSIINYVNKGYKIIDISLDLHHSDRNDIIMSEYEKKFVKKNNIIYYIVVKK